MSETLPAVLEEAKISRALPLLMTSFRAAVCMSGQVLDHDIKFLIIRYWG